MKKKIYQSSVKQSVEQILDVKRVVKTTQLSARHISKKWEKTEINKIRD